MKIFEADRKQYIKLGDLDHLLRGMRRDIYDKYIRDDEGKLYQEDGTKGLTKEDAIEVAVLANVMTRILQNKIHACETPREIEKIHERLVDEFYDGKYLVVVEQEEDGKKEKYFFKRYCLGALEKKLRDEGKTDEEIAEELEDNIGMPVFSGVLRDAEFFEDHESADSTVTFINHNYEMNAMVKPAWYFNPNVGKRIEKWLSEDTDEEEEE